MGAKFRFAFSHLIPNLGFWMMTMIIIVLRKIVFKNVDCENYVRDYILVGAESEVVPNIDLWLNLKNLDINRRYK